MNISFSNNFYFNQEITDVTPMSIESQNAAELLSEEHWFHFFDRLAILEPKWSTERENYTPLQVAAVLDDEKLCQKLLDEGCNSNEATSHTPDTPLHLALRFQRLETAKVLIAGGGDLKSTYEKEGIHYPLWHLLIEKKLPLLEHCIECGYLNPHLSHNGLTLLGWVIWIGWKEPMRKVIEAGGDLEKVVANVDEFSGFAQHIQKQCGMDSVNVRNLQTAWGLALSFPNYNQFLQILSLKEHMGTVSKATLNEQASVGFREFSNKSLYLDLLNLTENKVKSCLDTCAESLLHLALENLHKSFKAFRGELNKGAGVLSHETTVKHLIDWGFAKKIEKGITPYTFAKVLGLSDLEAVKRLKEEDKEVSKILKKIKIFGHRFSLKGLFFEGFYNTNNFFYYKFSKSLNNYFATHPYPGSKSIVAGLRSFMSSSPKELLKIQKDGLAIVIPTRWIKHATACVISGKRLYKVNTGEGAKYPGICYYQIREQENLEKTIEKLLDRKKTHETKEADMKFFNKEIDKLLQLKRLTKLVRTQNSENCMAEATLRVVETLFIDQKLGEKGSDSKADFIQAQQEIEPIFKQWEEEDMISSLHKFRNIMGEIEKCKLHIDIDTTLKSAMARAYELKYFRLMKELIKIEPRLVDWQGMLGCSLIMQLLFEKQYQACVELIQLGANLELKNQLGNSFLDQLRSYDFPEKESLFKDYL